MLVQRPTAAVLDVAGMHSASPHVVAAAAAARAATRSRRAARSAPSRRTHARRRARRIRRTRQQHQADHEREQQRRLRRCRRCRSRSRPRRAGRGSRAARRAPRDVGRRARPASVDRRRIDRLGLADLARAHLDLVRAGQPEHARRDRRARVASTTPTTCRRRSDTSTRGSARRRRARASTLGGRVRAPLRRIVRDRDRRLGRRSPSATVVSTGARHRAPATRFAKIARNDVGAAGLSARR